MKRIIQRLARARDTLQRRGPGYLGYLLTGWLLPNLSYHLLRLLPPAKLRKLFLIASALGWLALALWQGMGFALRTLIQLAAVAAVVYYGLRGWHLHRMRRAAQRQMQTATEHHFTTWDRWPVAPAVRERVADELRTNPQRELVLGQIDNDGRLLDRFGPLPGWVTVPPEQFVPRRRFPLDVVLLDGNVLIRKHFRGDRLRFVREWYTLTALAPEANVPPVYRVDEKRTLLYKNLIPGQTLRDVLVAEGARILSVQTGRDPELAELSGEQRLYAVLARGTRLLPDLFPETFFTALERQMDAIHRRAFARLSLTFGNVMIDDHGQPWLIDLEDARHYPSTRNLLFAWQRDRDREKFNRIYARDLLTEERARTELKRLAARGNGWYAPIDFGRGLTVGGFWSVDSGTGRWEYLNHRVLAPLLEGKRVLDLGSNNGVMPLMMLRDGAREVVGLERDPQMVARARLVHHIFEWRDMRPYPFTLYQADMRALLDTDWGDFDLITAFCSLYYLPIPDMHRMVRRAAELAPIIVLQAKTDTRPDAADDKAFKSSLAFSQHLLQKNGFPRVETYAPPGYSRPLLVGKTAT